MELAEPQRLNHMGRAWECALQLKQKQQNTSQEILTLSVSEALLQILLHYIWSSKDKMVWSYSTGIIWDLVRNDDSSLGA